jgi:hypothetical protein
VVGLDREKEYEAPEIVDLGPIEDVTFGGSRGLADGVELQPSAPSL